MAHWRVGLRLLMWTQVGYLATIVAVVGLVGVARPVVLGMTGSDGAAGSMASGDSVSAGSSLISISGTVVGRDQELLHVKERGGSHPVGFMVGHATAIRRGGEWSSLESLRPGDGVTLVVDGRTGRAERIEAVAGASRRSVRDWLSVAGPCALVALIAAAALLKYRGRTVQVLEPGHQVTAGAVPIDGSGRRPALIATTRTGERQAAA